MKKFINNIIQKNKAIVMKNGLCMLLLISTLTAFPQQDSIVSVQNSSIDYTLIPVSGKVVDAASGNPLPGVRVQSLDEKYSSMTNQDGVFNLRLPSASMTVQVVGYNYNIREYALRGKTQDITIALYPEVFSEDYGNIETLTGSQRQSSVSTSTARATGGAIGTALSLEAEIQSRLGADVRTITRSGTPGIGANMFIRGYNSLNANAQPLIVVDGIIYDRQLNRSSIHQGLTLNPLINIDVEDIQDITVLKDGTSLYGSKGGNGVILIKTRRGEDMVTRITASVTAGISSKPKLPSMMDADQYRTYLSDWYGSRYTNSMISTIPFFKEDPDYIYYNQYHSNTDWSDVVYRTAFTQSYNVGVNGGDEIALYNLSLGYTTSQSTLEANDLTRLNARFNTDIKLNTKLNLAFDISYSETERKLTDDGLAESYISGPITSLGVLGLIKSPFLSPYQFTNRGELTSGVENYDWFGVANPLAIIDYGKASSEQSHFVASVMPQYDFTDDLNLSTRFGYTYDKVLEHSYRPMHGIAPYYISGSGTSYNMVKTQSAQQISMVSDTRLTWNTTFGNLHNVNLFGGFRYFYDNYKGSFASGHNTGSDKVKEMSKGLNYKVVDGVEETWKSLGWYAAGEYNYLNKYILAASLALDSSSKFGKNLDSGIDMFGVPWGVFPSVNGAWILSAENFMKNIEAVNFLKLRAGYGLSGNDDIENYVARAYFNSVRYIDNAIGLQLANIENSSIQWETTKKFNVGIDFSLLDERLSFSADYYNHTTDNLLTLKQLKEISGLDYYWSNGGKLENKGFEVKANFKILNTPDLQWEVGAGIAKYKNKILELPDGDSYLTSIYGAEILTQVNNPAGLFYGYKTKGVFSTMQEAQDANLYALTGYGNTLYKFQAGDVHYINQNDDNIIDEKDKVVIGDPNPDFTGTFNTRFKYKRLTLDALFTFSYGNDVYNYLRSQLENGNYTNQTTAMRNRWISEGQVTSLPRITGGSLTYNNYFSDRWIEDGSYLRLKTLTVSYDVPLNLSFLPGFTVWMSANNLWTWTNYLGGDPEFSINSSVLYQGIDSGLLSQGRSYYVGLKINL